MKCWQCGIHFPDHQISDPKENTVYMCRECQNSGKILTADEIIALFKKHFVEEK